MRERDWSPGVKLTCPIVTRFTQVRWCPKDLLRKDKPVRYPSGVLLKWVARTAATVARLEPHCLNAYAGLSKSEEAPF